jgi:hypothetical protein
MRTYFEKSRTSGICKQCRAGIAKGSPAWWSQSLGWQCTSCNGATPAKSDKAEKPSKQKAAKAKPEETKSPGLKGIINNPRPGKFEIEFERMADALETGAAFGEGNRNSTELDDRVRKHQRTEWLGFKTTDQLRNVLRLGRRDLTEMVEKLREKISNELPVPKANKRRVRRGRDNGDEIDADRFLSRIPEMWNRIESDQMPANRVTVKINAAVSGSQKEKAMAYRAAAGLALADALTERGASVEVQLIWCSRAKSDQAEETISRVVVKKSDQPMSITDLAAACCDVGVVRMGLVIGTARMLPGKLHSGLGFPMEMPEDLTLAGFTIDRDVDSEAAAIRWVAAAVEKFSNQ